MTNLLLLYSFSHNLLIEYLILKIGIDINIPKKGNKIFSVMLCYARLNKNLMNALRWIIVDGGRP